MFSIEEIEEQQHQLLDDYESYAQEHEPEDCVSPASAPLVKEAREPLSYSLKSSVQIAFIELQHVTKSEELEQGALLLLVDDEAAPVWVPKKLCSNLDLDHNTVWVWDQFVDGTKQELIPFIINRGAPKDDKPSNRKD